MPCRVVSVVRASLLRRGVTAFPLLARSRGAGPPTLAPSYIPPPPGGREPPPTLAPSYIPPPPREETLHTVFEILLQLRSSFLSRWFTYPAIRLYPYGPMHIYFLHCQKTFF